jgi:hypothetical protein
MYPLYYDTCRRLLNDTKNKIKVQIAEKKDVHIDVWRDACRQWLKFGQQPTPFKYDVCLSGR